MANALAYGATVIDAGGGGSSSGGHIIQNANGLDMAQRTNLQFGKYLKTTDDSTNDKTVVEDNVEEITWEAYQELTDVQREGRHFIIVDAPESDLTANDITYDNTNSGLSATKVQDAIDEIENSIDIPRMKNWGTFSTLEEIETFLNIHNVSTGNFTGLRIGDYFTLGSYKVYIAGIDTEYNKGGTALSTHHITCIANFGNSQMNTTNTTTGGYNGATVMQNFLSGKATEISGVLGSHLLTRSTLLTNSVSDGKSNGWAWYDKQLTLLSETQIYGGIQWGNAFDTGEGYEKLPIFNELTPLQLFGRAAVWLRGVGSATNFCYVDNGGNPNRAGASYSLAAVALFCLG